MLTFEQVEIETCIPKSELINLSNRAHKHYRIITIAKKSGGERILHAPSFKIKGIQSWILRKVLDPIGISACATGFTAGKSIKTNAAIHAQNTRLLQLDIKDFFPSIKRASVKQILSSTTTDQDLLDTLTGLCCYKDCLPQGGVTSPSLSNIYLLEFDNKIEDSCSRLGYAYSRYADDITISGNDNYGFQAILREVEASLSPLGLTLNTSKTRLLGGKGALRITGLNINSGKPTVPKRFKKAIRADIHRAVLAKRDFPKETQGKIAFVCGIEPDYELRLKKYIRKLVQKYPEYRDAIL